MDRDQKGRCIMGNPARSLAVLAAVCLTALGTNVLSATPVGASVTGTAHPLGEVPSAPVVARPPDWGALKVSSPAAAKVTSPAAATSVSPEALSVAPPATLGPYCYGDSRPVTPVGRVLDPVSFGAFFNCAQPQWTFTVQTQDTWAPNSLGDWTVYINAGIFTKSTDKCDDFDYAAIVQQQPIAGTFVSQVGHIDQTCQFVGTPAAATRTITSNSVAVTFPRSAIGNAGAITWLAQLQNRSEEQGPCTSACGVELPSLTYSDGPIQGAIADSLPGVTSSACQTTPQATIAPPTNNPGLTPSSQWNLPVIGASAAWNTTHGSAAVKVADIDTGVDYSHPDLAGNLLPGRDESTGVLGIGTAMGPNPLTAQPNTDTGQTYAGRGTAVAGAIAALTNNSLGLDSLGFNTTVLPVKVNFDHPAAQLSTEIAAGIRWAADHGAQIINLSFGSTCQDGNVLSAIQYAQGQGVLVVAAAGNGALNSSLGGSNDAAYYPAAYPGVLAVGATGRDSIRAAYSNTGSYVSMVAPGGSAIPQNADSTPDTADNLPVLAPRDECIPPAGDGCYTTGYGTGFAAAQVSAAAALVWSLVPSVIPSITAAQVSQLLTSTATDLGISGGPDVEYGSGMLKASAAVTTPPVGLGGLLPLTPSRVLDTRTGTGGTTGPVASQGVVHLPVLGQGGVPTLGVAAVVLNVTVTQPAQGGFLTVYPDGVTRPGTSNLNFNAGQTVPNLVIAPVGTNGMVDFFNGSTGTIHIIADVSGWFMARSAPPPPGALADPSPGGLTPVTPVRLLYTRDGTGGTTGPVPSGATVHLTVSGPGAGAGAIPGSGVGAVALNVTVTGPAQPGFLTVYPDGVNKPGTSNLNFSRNQTVPNLVIAPLGTNGVVDFYNGSSGTVQIIADVSGWFASVPPPPALPAPGGLDPLTASRILDTRNATGVPTNTPMAPGAVLSLPVLGKGGVQASGVGAVVLNVTVTQPSAGGFLTVYPDGVTRPGTSNLNFSAGQTVPNLVIAPVGANGVVDFYNGSSGTVHVLADVSGWLSIP